MLTIRQRGKYWHIRGTVKEGRTSRIVAEQSTGYDCERKAAAYATQIERKIRAELTLGFAPKQATRPILFSDAATAFIEKTKPKYGELGRVELLTDGFTTLPLHEINAAEWTRFCRERMPGQCANSRARMQTTLRAIFREVGEGLPFPKEIRHGGERVERVRWLPTEQADKLIDCHTSRTRIIALTFRYLGLRTQECLQIQRPLFDAARGPHGSIYIEKSKNGRPRWVPLHPKVRAAWEPLLAEKCPTWLIDGRARDPLFLTDKRRPYLDTRTNQIGGNPFRRAHVGACARAGVDDFTPHDWRHHWASWAVRQGMDLRTLQQLGGWLDLNMVQRYAAVDFDDAAEKIARVR